MTHVFESQGGVILRRDVVRQVVIEDEAEKSIEEGEIDLLVHPREDGLHHHDTLAITCLPYVGQVVNALTPLVHEQRRRFVIAGLNPVGEKRSFVPLIMQILIEIGVR